MSDENPHSGSADPSGKNPNRQGPVPNCLKCSYFKVTWDTVFPRACEMFGFKTHVMPAHEVFRATGSNCPAFRLKDGLK